MRQSVLIVSSEFPPGPGGIGYHAYSLALSLHANGLSVKVLSPADYSSEDQISNFDSNQEFYIKRYVRKGKILTYLNRLRDTYRVIKNDNISIVFYTGKFSIWQSVILKSLGVKVLSIIILHGSEVNLSNALLRKFTHWAISNADIIVSVSRFTESLVPKNILENVKHVVIPNGIFPVSDSKVTHYKLHGSPVLLTVGHVSPRKGQHQVISALPKLLEKYPLLKYHIIGRPIYLEQFKKLAENLGVIESVIFHGILSNHEELLSTYKQADVFMLLSENLPNGDVEGFGIVALEANLNGLPVIGSIGTGVEDAIKEDQSGYLVDAKDEELIVKAVVKCLVNKDRLGKSSIDWALSHNWSIIVKQYLDLIA